MITKNEVLDNLEEVKKYVSEIETKKEGIAILNRYNDEVIFQSTKTIMKEAVEEAVEKSANLESADLEDANLESANLKYANLKYANLESADLKYANLEGADLEDANLENAYLESANLEDANLESANLENAKTTYCTINFSSSEREQAEQFIKGL